MEDLGRGYVLPTHPVLKGRDRHPEVLRKEFWTADLLGGFFEQSPGERLHGAYTRYRQTGFLRSNSGAPFGLGASRFSYVVLVRCRAKRGSDLSLQRDLRKRLAQKHERRSIVTTLDMAGSLLDCSHDVLALLPRHEEVLPEPLHSCNVLRL